MRYVGNMQMCFSPNDKANPSKKDVTVAIDSTKERLVIFDLSLPIEQQLREARSHLNNESKVEKIKENLKNQLRVL